MGGLSALRVGEDGGRRFGGCEIWMVFFGEERGGKGVEGGRERYETGIREDIIYTCIVKSMHLDTSGTLVEDE